MRPFFIFLNFLTWLIIAVVTLFSCEKTPESYVGKNIDADLVGTWRKTYSMRDFHNGITYFTDTMEFRMNNSGRQTIYRFNDLENSLKFEYYTENNHVCIRVEGMEDADWRTYKIRNDSLFFLSGIPYIKCPDKSK